MQVEMKQIEDIATKLNLSGKEVLHQSLKTFLEKKLRELKTEIYQIHSKYGISSVRDLEERYKKGTIEEKDTWQDLQKLDHLEFKRDEIEEVLRGL
jgi:hypothetical protein